MHPGALASFGSYMRKIRVTYAAPIGSEDYCDLTFIIEVPQSATYQDLERTLDLRFGVTTDARYWEDVDKHGQKV